MKLSDANAKIVARVMAERKERKRILNRNRQRRFCERKRAAQLLAFEQTAKEGALAWATANIKFADLSSTRKAGLKNIIVAAYLAGHAEGRIIGRMPSY